MPFQSLPFIRASSRDKAWQAALLPTLMGLYYDSPHSNHIVLWPSCPITLFSSHGEHPENTPQIHLKIQISVAGFKKQCFSMQFPLVIRHNQWKQQTGSVAKEKKKKLSARAFKYFLLSNWIFPVRNSRKCKLKVKVTQLCPTLCNPMDLYSPWNSPGQNTGVGSLSLLQGTSPTQGSNSGLTHCRWILYQLSHKGSPNWRSVSSVQLLSHVRLFATPWTAALQASLSITNSRSLLKLMSIESAMPSNHLILCRPLSSCLQSVPAPGSFQIEGNAN